MKLRDLLDISLSVDARVKDNTIGAELMGDGFDLRNGLAEEWLDAVVREIEVEENIMIVTLEVEYDEAD